MEIFLTALDSSHHSLCFFKHMQCIRVPTNQSENIKKEKKKENEFYIVGVLVIFSFYRAEFYLRLQYFSPIESSQLWTWNTYTTFAFF